MSEEQASSSMECEVCGCACPNCLSGINDSLDLHREIEELRSKLKKGNSQMSAMEREFTESRDFSEQEIAKLQDELTKLRDRYDRLFESHKKLQKLNHNLEDKLLTMVSKFDADRSTMQRDIASINSKLLDAKVTICDLEEECERYRNDCNVAVQLLQCKPSNFVAHKLNTLPLDLQERVKCHLSQQQIADLEDSANDSSSNSNEPKMIRVPMPTFPPTAMVYSVNKTATPAVAEIRTNKETTVDTTIIARVLTQPEPTRKPRRIYICTKCRADIMFFDKDTQTACTGGFPDLNSHYRGVNGNGGVRTSGREYPSGQSYHSHYPSVHRPRQNSTETEI